MTNYIGPSHIPDLGRASHTEHNNKCDQKLINLLLRVIGYSQKYFGYRLRVTNSALPVSLTQTFTLTLYMFISNAMFKNMEHIVVQKDSMSSSSYQSTIPQWDFLHSTFNGISQILFKPVSIVDHFSSNTFSTGISPTNNTNESVLAPLLECDGATAITLRILE